MTNLEVALHLARAGLFVLPCNPATKAPLLPSWPTRASNVESEIRAHWNMYGIDPMPGIAAGKSGLVVIDLDRKNGVDGCTAFDQLPCGNQELPRCPATLTPSGGYHLIYMQPKDRAPLGNRTGMLPKGIDIRGAGGQFIAPGSVRDTGEFYEACPGWPDLAEAYADQTIPTIPQWLISIIESNPAPAAGGPALDSRPRTAATVDKSAWAAEGLSREARTLAATGIGGRNHALYKFVVTFSGHAANGWTTRDEVFAAAWWACELNGYLASRDPSDGPLQFTKTFESGWRWGFSHPTAGPRERLTKIDPQFTAGLKPRPV